MTPTEEMVRVAAEEYLTAYVDDDTSREVAMHRALTAALAAMWRTDFENAPFMGSVLLTIEDRKLPIAVFRHNAEGPWRYLESGHEVQNYIIPTHWMPLPPAPTLLSTRMGSEKTAESGHSAPTRERD